MDWFIKSDAIILKNKGGQNISNPQPNYENHDDISRELSNKGLKDRRLVTEFLMDKQIDIVLLSPYKRAMDTVHDFAEIKGIDIIIIDEFKERRADSGWIEDFNLFHPNNSVISLQTDI